MQAAEVTALKGQESTIQAAKRQLGLEPVHRTGYLVNLNGLADDGPEQPPGIQLLPAHAQKGRMVPCRLLHHLQQGGRAHPAPPVHMSGVHQGLSRKNHIVIHLNLLLSGKTAWPWGQNTTTVVSYGISS